MVRFGIMSLLKPQQKPSILYCIFWTLDSNVCPGLNNFCFIFFTGKRLLTGGELLELWIESLEKGKNQDKQLVWKKSWQCETSTPVYHVQFSSDGTYFWQGNGWEGLQQYFSWVAKATVRLHAAINRADF